MDLTAHLLAGECRHDPKAKSQDGRQRHRQTGLGRTREAGRGGDRDDPSFRRWKGLLLHRLSEAGQEGLVDAPVGICRGLQFAQADLRLPRRRRLLEDFAHAPVDRLFLALRDLQLALVAFGDARDLVPDRALQGSHFRAQVSRGLVIGAVTGAPVRLPVLVVEELLAKLGDDGVAERVGDDGIGDIEAFLVVSLFQHPRDAIQLGPSLAGVGSGLGQRYPELVELDLACKLAVDADDDAVLGFEVLHFLVGIARLLAQLSDALFQPNAGATGRLKLCQQLVLDIGLGEGVGDSGGLVRIERCERDLFEVAASEPDHAQIVFDRG